MSLDSLFCPKSVAVVGASRKRGTVGAEIFHNLLSNDFQGVVYPVNPNSPFIQAVKAYPRVTDIPGPVDLAVIVVPKEHVLAAAEDCATKGVKAMVVISAGFGETGANGKEREGELLKLCRSAGIRLVGPNCLGILNTAPEVRLNATFAPTYPPEGNIAFSSQSGALGLTILDYAKELGIGISHFVSVGNKSDVSGNDLIRYWDKDPRVDVVLLYLESFGNPRSFLEISRDVGRRMPIVAVKSGRSAIGARAAASHTGSLAGSEAGVNAIFKQSGAIRVDTVEELFDMAMLLANQPLPMGKRVAVLTNAGGPGIMAADACENWGLEVSKLSEKTMAKLMKFLPPEASVKNPVDMIASASAESFEKAIPILLEDDAVDSLLVIYVPPIVTRPKEVADAIVKGASGSEKPVVSCFLGTHGVPQGLKLLKKGQIPSYAFPEAAVTALHRAYEHSAWRQRDPGQIRLFSDTDHATIQRMTSKSGWLSATDAFTLLQAAQIPVAPMAFASTIDDVAACAKKVGFPLVLKIDSDKILHKTEFGGVALSIQDEAAACAAAKNMFDRAKRENIPPADIRGFLLQKMAPRGVEIIVGCTDDGKFGPLLMFGLGGVAVEIWRDVSFRICPLTDKDAEQMVYDIHGFKLLDGYRGAPKSDVRAIQTILERLSELVTRFPRIVEFDLNPIRVFKEGEGAMVLDARVRIDAER